MTKCQQKIAQVSLKLKERTIHLPTDSPNQQVNGLERVPRIINLGSGGFLAIERPAIKRLEEPNRKLLRQNRP